MKNQNSKESMLGVCKSSVSIESTLLLFSCLFMSIHLVGCGDKQEAKPRITTLNTLLENVDHDCANALLTVGNELIGSKESLLQLETFVEVLDADNIDSSKENKSPKFEKPHVSDMSDNPLIVSGVLKYNDRPTHVHFNAGAAGHQCLIRYQLDYHFTQPCMVIREEAFKKWNQIGILGDDTRLYVHKRKPNRKVYLTGLERGVQCLVSVRDIQVFPN